MANKNYAKNLRYFLEHTDEDYIISRRFFEQFPEKFRGSKDTLLWLDVGTGQGNKLIKILKGLDNHKGLLSGFSDITLDMLEPSKVWQTLKEKFGDNLGEVFRDVHQLTWEEFKGNCKYDLITFFHSVYGINTASLTRIPDFLEKDGCACIVVESSDSDLHQIKEGLRPYMHYEELMSSAEGIAEFLRKNGINCELSENVSRIKFYVSEMLDQPEGITPLSFLLYTKPEDHNKTIPEDIQKRIIDELERFAKKDRKGESYIEISDKFVWVYK